MARILIPKNAGQFKVALSTVHTYIVSNGKSGGNRITIPCKSKEQADKLCNNLNGRDKSRELVIWM